MPADYDALSDGSELTGDDSASDLHLQDDDDDDDDDESMARTTPSKKRRRIVRAVMRDEDDEEDEDEDEVADALEDDDDDDADGDVVVDDDADELDEDDEEYDAPSSSRRGATRTSGRKAAASSLASSTPKRSARTSARTASTPTASSGKKSLRVKLTRTPNSAAAAASAAATVAKEESSPAPKSRSSRSTAAASVSTPPSRRAKDATKIKWKPRSKAKDSDDDDLDLPDAEDDELNDDDDIDITRGAPTTADPDGDALSASDSDSSEPDEATAAEMQAIIGKTARQLAREGGAESSHMELPMFDPNRKKKLTENELALRRSETARKRKNQVEKKLEDDKVETINRLLKKQVGRSRNKLPRAGSAEDSDEEAEQARRRGREELSRKALKEMPAPFFRLIDRAEGKVLGVPTGPPLVEELLGVDYVQVNQALIQELDAPMVTQGLSEKAKKHEEKARKRLEAQSEQWKQDHALDQVWRPEGLYEYQLRTVLGQSRKDWIGSRRPPTPEQEEQPQEEDAEAEGDGEGDGERQGEDQGDAAADDAEDDKE